ncbi:hypothetical protein EVB27_146 [Rhizobium phage RHph_TM16]|nr:hypothetical protein EVB27_146 [Rhizobium phage RHph_TM16]
MKLIPAATVTDHLGTDLDDAKLAAASAISVATAVIEARLDTLFDKATTVDTFYDAVGGVSQGSVIMTSFFLKNGFVQGTVTGTYAPEHAAFGTDDESSDLSLVVSAETGLVVETKADLKGKFVRLSYTYGFDVENADPTLYKQSQVPAWLKEACKLLALITMENVPAQEKAGTKQDTKLLARQFEAIISRRVRYAPGAVLAI